MTLLKIKMVKVKKVPGFDYDDPDFNFYRIPLAASGYKGYGVGKPNDGSVEKSDFEASLRENAPMFNLDNFIKQDVLYDVEQFYLQSYSVSVFYADVHKAAPL